MDDSILTCVKKMLGITEEYTHFDTDITILINASLSTLSQIGVGPSDGLSISDNTSVWSEIADGSVIGLAKQFIFLKVKLTFDPPSSSAVMTAMQNQIDELIWRMDVESK